MWDIVRIMTNLADRGDKFTIAMFALWRIAKEKSFTVTDMDSIEQLLRKSIALQPGDFA
jgi:hypothetical protein